MGQMAFNVRAGQPQYMGTAAISDGDYVHVAIGHADLIIMVGHDVVEKPPFFMHPRDTRKVHPQPLIHPEALYGWALIQDADYQELCKLSSTCRGLALQRLPCVDGPCATRHNCLPSTEALNATCIRMT